MTLKSVAATTSHRRLCPYTRRLLRYAVSSRFLVLILITVWRYLLSPYDTSASINPPCLSSSNSSNPPPPVLLPSVGSAIESSIVWDGVYFIRIAECGYEYEQTYAFLPLLPLCVSLFSKTGFFKVNLFFHNFILELLFVLRLDWWFSRRKWNMRSEMNEDWTFSHSLSSLIQAAFLNVFRRMYQHIYLFLQIFFLSDFPYSGILSPCIPM